MKKKPRFDTLLLTAMLLLSGCATAPIACLSRPVPPAPEPLGESFQEEMQRLLSGSLLGPTPSAQPSTPVKSEKR